MQENIALAIKTALEENKDKFVEKSRTIDADLKRPDLFSLSNETELFSKLLSARVSKTLTDVVPRQIIGFCNLIKLCNFLR